MEVEIMKKLFSALSAIALAAAGLFLVVPASQANPQSMTQKKLVFACEIKDNQYVTVPQLIYERSNWRYPALTKQSIFQEYEPLLVWTVALASDHPEGIYLPQGRCEAVSTRLTNLASSMGITSIQELSKVGTVNHEQVIFLSESPMASPDEVVFTLKPDNRDDASEILKAFQVGVLGAVGGPDLIEVSLPIYE
jgi:hypothetical protein